MSREWKPGDVALLQAGTSCGRIGLRTATNDAWRTAAGLMSDASCPEGAVHRPLVVIDPEDREQVEELIAAYSSQPRWHAGYMRDRIDAMQAALREFANPTPPKPAEPTGLGAVVEDAKGERWIRAARIAHGWHRPMGTWAAYAEIDAVRVLSEGVTA